MKKEIIFSLKNNGIGIFPTDTLYGVVGSAFSKKAVKRIYDLKGRDENKPFIILIGSLKDLELFGKHSNILKNVRMLWQEEGKKKRPRPLSIIVPVSQKKFEYLHRGAKSLAFRLPHDKYLRAFLKKTGPLVAPSANPQGLPPAETIAQAEAYFGDKVDFYVDGGKKKGKPSKIISLLSSTTAVIRK